MLALVVSVRVKPDQREVFLAAAKDNSTCAVRDEPGCVQFDVGQDEADENHFVFFEVYRDRAAFEAHLKTPHFERWRAASSQVLSSRSERTDYRLLFEREN